MCIYIIYIIHVYIIYVYTLIIYVYNMCVYYICVYTFYTLYTHIYINVSTLAVRMSHKTKKVHRGLVPVKEYSKSKETVVTL